MSWLNVMREWKKNFTPTIHNGQSFFNEFMNVFIIHTKWALELFSEIKVSDLDLIKNWH